MLTNIIRQNQMFCNAFTVLSDNHSFNAHNVINMIYKLYSIRDG